MKPRYPSATSTSRDARPQGTGSKNPSHRRAEEIICRCNNVSRGSIEQAIREGCGTLNEIFDATTAGVGPCGGSCRRKLKPLLDAYLNTGEFPEKIVEDLRGKSKSG